MTDLPLEFDPATHTYARAGIVIPNVTSVINWMNDYAGIREDVMQRAREFGEAVHLATAMHDQGILDESSVPDEIRGHFAAWLLFRSNTNFEPLAIEQRVESRKYGYAGTLDRNGVMGTHNATYNAMIDVKATAALPPSVGPQTAAYLNAAVESGQANKKTRRFTVQLRADGTFRLQEHTDKADLSVFLSSLNMYNWSQRWKSK